MLALTSLTSVLSSNPGRTLLSWSTYRPVCSNCTLKYKHKSDLIKGNWMFLCIRSSRFVFIRNSQEDQVDQLLQAIQENRGSPVGRRQVLPQICSSPSFGEPCPGQNTHRWTLCSSATFQPGHTNRSLKNTDTGQFFTRPIYFLSSYSLRETKVKCSSQNK